MCKISPLMVFHWYFVDMADLDDVLGDLLAETGKIFYQQKSNLVSCFLAHLWGAYAIPVALSVGRRLCPL